MAQEEQVACQHRQKDRQPIGAGGIGQGKVNWAEGGFSHGTEAHMECEPEREVEDHPDHGGGDA